MPSTITFTKEDLKSKPWKKKLNRPPVLIVSKRVEQGEYELIADLDMLYVKKRVYFKVGRKINGNYTGKSARKIQASSSKK